MQAISADDLSTLAEVHGDPDHQYEHCLRSADQREPGGSEAAVAKCRAFIRSSVEAALDGLDADGTPDVSNRTTLTVHLALRGTIDVALPTYYVRMGQAVHAIEDGFSHTFRSADQTKITVVLNWVARANGDWVESRDGPAHEAKL